MGQSFYDIVAGNFPRDRFKRKIIPQDEKSARLVVDRKQCSFRFDIIHARILTVCQSKSELLQSSR